MPDNEDYITSEEFIEVIEIIEEHFRIYAGADYNDSTSKQYSQLTELFLMLS